jgi:hypothetical protein
MAFFVYQATLSHCFTKLEQAEQLDHNSYAMGIMKLQSCRRLQRWSHNPKQGEISRNLHEETRDLALHLPHFSQKGNGARQVRCSQSLTPLCRSRS